MLIADVKWKEPYVSAGLNRKFAGVLPHGVYWGFEVAPGGGLVLRVHHGDDPDYPESVAVVDHSGYSVTIRMDAGELLDVSGHVGAGRRYLVLEAAYQPDQNTVAVLKTVAQPEERHVVLCAFTLPAGSAEITPEMLDFADRSIGNPHYLQLRFMADLMLLSADNIILKSRLANIENWARGQGYDSATLY